jgi:UDP-glucose:(heptosyl)LPS alpha-1,3-glucosyltransferase
MKVAIAVKEHVESKGGLERYAVTLARGLRDRGVEVHVFANRWEGDDGMVFHYVPCVRWSSLLRVLTFPMNLRKHLATGSFDIVYSLTPFYPLDVYRIGEGLHVDALRLRYPGPFRRALRYLNPKHLAILYIEKKMFEEGNYRRIIANSNMLKERVIELYGVPPGRVQVVYNGYDARRFNPGAKKFRAEVRAMHGIGENERVVLFVSNDFKRKGLDYLMDALGALKRRDFAVRLLVVGSAKPAVIKKYRGLAERAGIGHWTTFAGAVRDVEKYYGAGDVFVLPTLYDPFSNACLEAMACGLPVVTTRRNGASEIITEGGDGYVIEDGSNARVLADRIFSAFSLDGAGARAVLKAGNYTAAKNVSATLDMLSDLAGAGKVVQLRHRR